MYIKMYADRPYFVCNPFYGTFIYRVCGHCGQTVILNRNSLFLNTPVKADRYKFLILKWKRVNKCLNDRSLELLIEVLRIFVPPL